MPKFCVCVTFHTVPESQAAFVRFARDQSRNSLTEAGCEVFDVWTDPKQPNRVFLYEVYAEEAAFAVHLKTSHFLNFSEETKAMVVQKDVQTWSAAEHGHD